MGDIDYANYEQLPVHGFIIGQEQAKNIKLSFRFIFKKDRVPWENALSLVKSKMSGADLQIDISSTSSGYYLIATLNVEDLETFLNLAKSDFDKAKFRNFTIENSRIDVMHICTNFFKEKSVELVTVAIRDDESSDFFPWLVLIKNLNPISVDYKARLTKDSVKFLLHLADISNTIRIIVGRNSDSKANILTIVRDVLNKRCEELVIIDRFSNKKITWLTCADVEKFIQMFHQLDKKVQFTAQSHCQLINTQIGNYQIWTFSQGPQDHSVHIYCVV